MARAAATAPRRRSRGRRRSRLRVRLRRWWPRARQRRRWLRAFRGMPPGAQVVSGLCAVALVWAVANGLYQVARKPTELFFPVSGTLFKTPAETWNAYATLFRRHSTETMSPTLLAALAQVEGSGNPIARTYWRWSWRAHPFEVYRPASSAVGMYQITDGTFDEAKRFCIHDHVLTEDGPWYAWRSCWLNALYFRVIPSHAIELTSAYLDRAVQTTLARRGVRGASLAQRQKLAALIHLCGAAAGDRFARRGFTFTPSQRCGDHEARLYVERVDAMKAVFAVLAARDR